MDTKHSKHSPRPNRNGFSLVEAMIVVAVTAIVATSAVPSLSAFIDGRRLNAAATALAADVQFVRTEAIARNRPIRLSLHASAPVSCWVVHTGLAAQCACAESGPAVCSGGAAEIKTVVLGAADRVLVQANVASILFDPLHGTSTPTGTLRLIDPRGRAVHHVVNVMGRVRSCSPAGAVPGWRAC
ncbi:MAG: GspH/FimT family pseudopilin [Caldimonas sp.]